MVFGQSSPMKIGYNLLLPVNGTLIHSPRI